jgi:hypothetical protein
MAEDRKILLDIELNSAQGLKSLVDIKQRIADLKKEQASLNTTTQEGKIQFAAYQAQITNLSKESRSLENALAQTAGAFNFESGSIAANRAELSKLTAEYKNIAKPTEAQTKAIKQLSDTLKTQEAALGQAQRNVGNYTESINAAGVGNTLFGRGLATVQEGSGKFKAGLDLAKTGLTTFKGALAATGIGLLLLAITSLIDYFKKTDEGATQLEGAFKAVGAVVDVLGKGLTIVSTAIFKAVNDPKQAVIDFGNLVKENLINRFTSFGVILEGIKTGDFTKIGNGVVQLGTGIENASGKIGNLVDGAKRLGEEIAAAAKEGFNLALAFDDLDDRQRDFLITNAESNKQIAQLLLQMKNKTASQQESLALAEQASKIELESFKQNKAFALENVQLIERENNLALTRLGITKEQIAAASSQADRAALVGKLAGENAQKEVDARVRVINLEQESLVIQEKIQNRIDAIKEAAEAKRKAAADKAAKELDDQLKRDEEYYNKRRAMVAQADKEENDRTAFRLSQDVKNASERVNFQQTQSALLIQNENLTYDQKIAIAQENQTKLFELIEIRIQAEKDEVNQLAAIQSEAGVNTLLIEQQRVQKIIDINKKAATEKQKIGEQTTAEVKKQSDAQQKIDEVRTKNALGLASQSAGTLAALFKENTIAFKVLASIQAVIDAYRAANAALASGSEINPIFGAIAAGSTLLLGLANVAKINGITFARGGYTGPGFGSPDESGFKQAGIVHEHEYVVPKRIVQSPAGSRLVANLEGMRTRGYAMGGLVNDGGIGQRRISQPVYESASIVNRQKDIMESLPPIEVSVVQINDAQAKTARVKERANL